MRLRSSLHQGDRKWRAAHVAVLLDIVASGGRDARQEHVNHKIIETNGGSELLGDETVGDMAAAQHDTPAIVEALAVVAGYADARETSRLQEAERAARVQSNRVRSVEQLRVSIARGRQPTKGWLKRLVQLRSLGKQRLPPAL